MEKSGVSPENQSGNWYAVRVEPGRERRVEWVMEHRFGLERYIPAVDSMVTIDAERWQRQKFDITDDEKVPLLDVQSFRGHLIPGFVFVRCEMSDALAHAIGESPYVVRLMPSNLAPWPISDASIDRMRKECERLVRQTGEVPELDWMLGKAFRVEQGPMAGRVGVCFSFSDKGDPEITLEVFKARYQPVPISVQHLNLEPVPDEFAQDVEIFRQKRISKATNRRNRCRTRAAS